MKTMISIIAFTISTSLFAASQLAINGLQVGALQSYEGGMPRALVLENLNASKKDVKEITIDSLDFNLTNVDSMLSTKWIQESISNPGVLKDILITDCDVNNRTTNEFALEGNKISEIILSDFNASDKSVGSLSLEVIPTTTSLKKSSSGQVCKPINTKTKNWIKSNFKFELGKLDNRSVSKISEIKISFGNNVDPRENKSGVAKYENIFVTVSGPSVASWLDWYNTFIIQGKNRDEDELQGSIVALDATLKQELFRVNLQNVGIVSMKRNPSQDGRIETLTFELYVEKIGF